MLEHVLELSQNAGLGTIMKDHEIKKSAARWTSGASVLASKYVQKASFLDTVSRPSYHCLRWAVSDSSSPLPPC